MKSNFIKGLAWDSSTQNGVFAAFEIDKNNPTSAPLLKGELVQDVKATHSERLLPSIHQLLNQCKWKLQEIDFIAVGQGPGSFTGLRIGITSANSLGYALKIPVVGFSSLELLERSIEAQTAELMILTRDACKGELFVRVVSGRLPKQVGTNPLETVCTPNELIDLVKNRVNQSGSVSKNPHWLMVGDGDRLYPEINIELSKNTFYKSRIQNKFSTTLPHRVNTESTQNLSDLAPISLSPKALVEIAGESYCQVPSSWILPRYLRKSNAEINLEKKS